MNLLAGVPQNDLTERDFSQCQIPRTYFVNRDLSKCKLNYTN